MAVTSSNRRAIGYVFLFSIYSIILKLGSRLFVFPNSHFRFFFFFLKEFHFRFKMFIFFEIGFYHIVP